MIAPLFSRVLAYTIVALIIITTVPLTRASDAQLPKLQPGTAPIIIGLDADMSSGSAEAGEAIRRGIELAMNEINQAGGVLGRPLQLVVRDHRGNPARGVDNVEAFARIKHLVAVVGGLHTPVALQELATIHRHQIVYLVPWAAGTGIIANNYKPNFAFRVSVRDEYAGEFLISRAIRSGYQRPGLLLERTGWGRSNEQAMTKALAARGLKPAGIRWFNWGARDMTNAIKALVLARADVIMLVANAPEGSKVVNSMSALPQAQRLPIISHWGITGGQFFNQSHSRLVNVELTFLQTFSFLAPPFPDRARRVLERYCRMFPNCQSPRSLLSPVGTAHAYDLINLLALAIRKAGTIERAAVRDALEQLDRYEGLVRNYDPPFTVDHHDALTVDDFRLAQYDEDGAIIPVR
jgi:branched-chain amino acid transport system substrate-binding protein